MSLVRRERFDFPGSLRRFFDAEWDAPWLRVEEFVDGKSLVIRAELPDVDPDKDVELSVADGTLHIRAERHEKTEHKEKDSYRSEFRYGSFVRNVALPVGCKEDDVKASYKDGVLEIRIPVPDEAKSGAVRVPISRS